MPIVLDPPKLPPTGPVDFQTAALLRDILTELKMIRRLTEIHTQQEISTGDIE